MKNEEWYVILNMNCKYEICRMCPKSGLFKGSYEECENWIKQKQKEEKKDEMKNRISMALKDPILQQGFEIICKENAELKKKLKEKLKTIADKDLSFVAKFDALEKENAELKADNEARKFAMAMSEKVEKQLREENVELKEKLNFSTQYYQGEKAKEQLTKAKNALKKFVDFANGERIIPVKWIAEAEQFIKESE